MSASIPTSSSNDRDLMQGRGTYMMQVDPRVRRETVTARRNGRASAYVSDRLYVSLLVVIRRVASSSHTTCR
eukprot:418557-Pyramimonas_sp.AAC.2